MLIAMMNTEPDVYTKDAAGKRFDEDALRSWGYTRTTRLVVNGQEVQTSLLAQMLTHTGTPTRTNHRGTRCVARSDSELMITNVTIGAAT